MILERAAQAAILDDPEGLIRLMGVIATTFDRYPDMRSLSAVVEALHHPLSLDAIDARLHQRVRALVKANLSQESEAIDTLIRHALDLPVGRPPAEAPTYPADSRDDLLALVAHQRTTWRLDAEQDQAMIEAIVATRTTSEAYLQRVLGELSEWAASPLGQADADALLTADLLPADPELVERATTGGLQGAFTLSDGTLTVIGTDDPNTYDMSLIDQVIDPGGDDTYRWPADAKPRNSQSITDLAGNDQYLSHAPFVGPGTAAFGYSVLDDRQGNDTYRTDSLASIAAGVMGVGVLIDRAGNDVYDTTGPMTAWNLGVGFYGAGVLLDRSGSDVYRSERLSQGVGGAHGFGTLIDQSGNDFYFANGPSNASAYGTPAVYLGLSQGVGYGVRGHAAGGLGALYDLGGNDEYTAGEFSQGGGYFFAMGILHDTSGSDLYHANRYAQAFAAHQAAGLLIDDAGDDTYWAKTAAAQSGSWDECTTMFIDRAGNDAYRCDALGMGSAAMQAIAVFIDQKGQDRYAPAGNDSLGRSGVDTYHYDRDRVLSFSFFLDAGGSEDAYPPRRINTTPASSNTPQTTGDENTDQPAKSTRFGIFIDE